MSGQDSQRNKKRSRHRKEKKGSSESDSDPKSPATSSLLQKKQDDLEERYLSRFAISTCFSIYSLEKTRKRLFVVS